ncbi:GNAT family N-acetyltransferase [Streptomyces sp. NPDC093085]|uniref:GNAT family N-acetyltransferase n=1 Tax=Streptomyces sp. NPDC093085 TaxID=3155068 RepID=UPI00342CE508
MAELKAAVMRADLVRLGRYDEHRVRQRLRDSFSLEHTSVIVVEGDRDDHDGVAGSVTVRPVPGGLVLEHFYLAARHQGLGLGSAVLRTVLKRADEQGLPVRLVVVQGSAARRLYERHGFALESEDPIDVTLLRPPPTPGAVASSGLHPQHLPAVPGVLSPEVVHAPAVGVEPYEP